MLLPPPRAAVPLVTVLAAALLAGCNEDALRPPPPASTADAAAPAHAATAADPAVPAGNAHFTVVARSPDAFELYPLRGALFVDAAGFLAILGDGPLRQSPSLMKGLEKGASGRLAFCSRDRGNPDGARCAVPGPGNQNLYALTPAGVRIFYLAQGSDHTELWTSDGTEAGTRSVAALRAMGSLTAVGARVFFYADDGQHGFELWTSDGTPGGTRLVRDIAPGLASSFPDSLGAAGDRIFFAADDGVHGIEPWVSDGTAEGTHLLEDLSPGPASSSPSQFVASGDVVYFAASDDEAGKQIWSIAALPDETVPPRGRPRTPRVAPPRD